MPHGLEYEHAAKMYGLEYVRADDRDSFRQAFSESVNGRLSRIIEVRTNAEYDLQRRQEIMDAVRQRIAELDLERSRVS
jgi:2-succinyl-5-enolpyruvyl-6-hydroxy-3-cyclohexene-1-carboxylate synthase